MVPSRSKRQPPSPREAAFLFCPSEANRIFVCHLSGALARRVNSARSKAGPLSRNSPRLRELEGKFETLRGAGRGKFALSLYLTARVDVQ